MTYGVNKGNPGPGFKQAKKHVGVKPINETPPPRTPSKENDFIAL